LGGVLHVTSDSRPSREVARRLRTWWRAFCAGEIVSQVSLNEMGTFHDGYGLGLYDVAESYEQAVGHAGGGLIGYRAAAVASWAGCLPEEHAVVVVLSNRMVDISGVALPLVEAASSD
jgi:CubicO group peptidase (beta-lactamase class C family)